MEFTRLPTGRDLLLPVAFQHFCKPMWPNVAKCRQTSQFPTNGFPFAFPLQGVRVREKSIFVGLGNLWPSADRLVTLPAIV